MQRLGGDSKLRLIFVDEFSFLSQAHLSAMSRRCQQTSRDFTQPFGSYHVVLVGDPRQHDPPNAAPLVRGAHQERTGAVSTPRPGPVAAGRAEASQADGISGEGDSRAAAAPRCGANLRASEADGRYAFLSFTRVINLEQQQRVDDSPAGQTLRRYASLFMGEEDASRDDVVEFCTAWQDKAEAIQATGIDHLLSQVPRVVTQRQKARLEINFSLALHVAAALGRRAAVWLSTHASKDAPVGDGLQQAIRQHANPNNFNGLPAALVFFEVRNGARMRNTAHCLRPTL